MSVQQKWIPVVSVVISLIVVILMCLDRVTAKADTNATVNAAIKANTNSVDTVKDKMERLERIATNAAAERKEMWEAIHTSALQITALTGTVETCNQILLRVETQLNKVHP